MYYRNHNYSSRLLLGDFGSDHLCGGSMHGFFLFRLWYWMRSMLYCKYKSWNIIIINVLDMKVFSLLCCVSYRYSQIQYFWKCFSKFWVQVWIKFSENCSNTSPIAPCSSYCTFTRHPHHPYHRGHLPCLLLRQTFLNLCGLLENIMRTYLKTPSKKYRNSHII